MAVPAQKIAIRLNLENEWEPRDHSQVSHHPCPSVVHFPIRLKTIEDLRSQDTQATLLPRQLLGDR